MTQVFACTGMGLRKGLRTAEPSPDGVNTTEYYASLGAKPANTKDFAKSALPQNLSRKPEHPIENPDSCLRYLDLP
jgi:hypothetical protein